MLAHPGLFAMRRSPVNFKHSAGQSQPVLPRAQVSLISGSGRHYTCAEVVGLVSQLRPARPCANRIGGPDDHDRPGPTAGARFLPVRHAPASPIGNPARAGGLVQDAPTRRRSPIQPHTGTVWFSKAGSRRTSMPVLPVRCCTTDLSVERRSSRHLNIAKLRTMISGSADDGWSTGGIPSDWAQQPGYHLATVLDWESCDHTPGTRATPPQRAAYRACAGPRRRGAGTAVTSTRSAIRRVSPIGRCRLAF